MFSLFSRQLVRGSSGVTARAFSTSISAREGRVAVLGAAGGIGQPLSLLLKESALVKDLRLYDVRGTPGVAADLSHINTHSEVSGHLPENNGLEQTLQDCDVVVIPAGVPRKPGMTRGDLFKTNATIVAELATACAKFCPKAYLLIIANPVNSTVPIVAEVFKKTGVFDPKRLFGVTTLDVVRASRFIGSQTGQNPNQVKVPVVGGHAGTTIIPLFSQVKNLKLSEDETKALTHRVQFGGDEVVKAKDGAGSATLSMAFAGARFTFSLLKALQGEKGVIEPAYVESPLFKQQGVEYFSSLVELGTNGVEKINPLGNLTPFEKKLVDEALPQLKTNIQKGVEFVKSF